MAKNERKIELVEADNLFNNMVGDPRVNLTTQEEKELRMRFGLPLDDDDDTVADRSHIPFCARAQIEFIERRALGRKRDEWRSGTIMVVRKGGRRHDG